MDDFYQAFENKFRGDRELIKNRLSVYLRFIQPLKSLYPDSPVIDLGCGRGEWLELLGEYGGFTPRGVDLSEAMLDNAKAQGLVVEQQDALVCLKALPDGSQSIVSGFHIAEHLVFAELQTLVSEAHRVLRPGGLLILETPNPENIIVGTTDFYRDPTHLQPLPPDLLEFLAAYAGFCRGKIIRLQEPYDLERHGQVTLLNVLDGVSPDYAVVAQKQADSTTLALFDPPFDDSYGLTLSALATRFNQEQNNRVAQVDARYRELAEGHGHLSEQLHRLDESHQGLVLRLQDLEQQTIAALAREADMLSSKSWRYTQVLRRIANWFRARDK
jgi:O-antigen chain-terminating methyltransferase